MGNIYSLATHWEKPNQISFCSILPPSGGITGCPRPVGTFRHSPDSARSPWDCPAGTATGHLARSCGTCCAHPPPLRLPPRRQQDGRKRPTWPCPGHGAPKPARLACGLSGRGRCGALPTASRTAPRSPDKGMAWRAGASSALPSMQEFRGGEILDIPVDQ